MAFINELTVERYRGINNLNITGLKQINLIVGDNNCGKTSVLEAIQLLKTSGSLANVYRIARQRDALSSLSGNSLYDGVISMFPCDDCGEMSIVVRGKSSDRDITFSLNGKQERILLDLSELGLAKYKRKALDVVENDVETESFEGDISLIFGERKKDSMSV